VVPTTCGALAEAIQPAVVYKCERMLSKLGLLLVQELGDVSRVLALMQTALADR
jgi:hypothetical protein